MDLDGLEPQIRHFPATIKSTGQTQLDVLRDMIVQIFPLVFWPVSRVLHIETKIS